MFRTTTISLSLLALTVCDRPDADTMAHVPSVTVAPVATTSSSAKAANAAPSQNPGFPEVEPGGIGDVRLGMTMADLERLETPITDAYAGKQIGPFRVLFDAGRVSFIEVMLESVPGLRIGGQDVLHSEKDITKIAALLPDCGEMQINLGGNVIACHGGKVVVGAGGPTGVVGVQVRSLSYE